EIPNNAFATGSSFGRSWECERGFRAVGRVCVAVNPPQNAHLNYSGSDWECDRPYQRRDDQCIEP
ncbi:MAG: hypothetical protein ACR2PG_06015, partial [Hyphomicrobiaceae bacterium]